jgi:hypothetical protein
VKKTASFGILLVFCSAAVAADAVQPLDVKTGLWETTVNMDRTGAPPIPPEVLARLTPEQRAKFEERMKSAAGQGAKPVLHKHCLTKEELNKPLSFGSAEQACQRTIMTSSGSKQEIRVECAKATMKSSGTVRVEAVDSENVKGATQMTMTDGTRTMTIKSTFTSKWIGPVCTDEKK